MTREIKFRAWDKRNKQMLTVAQFVFDTRGEAYLEKSPIIARDKDYNHYSGDFESMEIMQFTGLKDKNGKEIYEGDIVKFRNPVYAEIIYLKGCFFAGNEFLGDRPLYNIKIPYEVIGNIYENPELFKEE